MADIISENNDLKGINWVNGMSDPGEMLKCGYLPQLRRLANEQDEAYAARIRPLIAALPQHEREKIESMMIAAAKRRAGLDVSTGKVAVFVAGEAAWHRLGKNISDAVTSEEAIKLAVLDWEVEKQAVYLANGTKVAGAFANVRLDTGAVLGSVGSQYKVFQNASAFAFMDGVIGAGLAKYETAGALSGGKRVWMLARIPQELRVAGTDDVTHPYALLCNSHDGTGAVRVIPTAVRVVCNNTLTMSLRKSQGGKQGMRIRHTTNMDTQVSEARGALGIVVKRFVTLQEQMDALAKVSLKGTEVRDYFEQMYPTKPKVVARRLAVDGASVLNGILDARGQSSEIVSDLLAGNEEEMTRQQKRNAAILEQLLANFENSKNSLPGIQGTAWAAYNAVSEYVDHQSTARGKDAGSRDNARLNSIWFGAGADRKQEAFQLALELVAAGGQAVAV